MTTQVRILVIDDRQSQAWFTQRVLQHAGFSVTTASDGAEGLRRARAEQPDLIILDTVMPRMDGFEVYRQLRLEAGPADTPVLFLTIDEKVDRKKLSALKQRRPARIGRRQPEDEREALVNFLTKPFTAEEVTAAVEDLLESGRLRASNEAPAERKPLVLVIDDALSLVRLAERTLQKEGFDVITANDGLEGLSKVRQENPDLVVLDIVMPGLDGLQVLQLIRRHTTIPVIMLTSDRDMDTVKKTLELGADGFLVKPVSTAELVARVREHLSGVGAAVD